MSFSFEIKNEIMKQSIKNACCRKAFLDGVMSGKATVENDIVTLTLENIEFSEFIAKFIIEFYGRTPEISTNPRGGRCRCISFFSKSASKYLRNIEDQNVFFGEKCAGCYASFLKGYFFACGKVSDPQKQYLLEFTPVRNCDKFAELLQEIGILSGITNRKGKEIIYIKKSALIEDFFAFAGLNSAAFSLMNAKIKGELRNNANRIANCEMNNIDKAVSASHKQISVIEALEKANLLSSLPEELEKTARLRLQRRDLSLSQLALISVPPISKSGLSHRLNKIMEIAGQLMPRTKKYGEK